jgi:hypothetical protein
MKTKFVTSLIFLSLNVWGETSHQKAYRLHNRLCSVPPSRSELFATKALIEGNQQFNAAMNIINSCPGFYNVTIPSLVKSWTNTSRFSRIGTNDMVTTMVGFVRDDIPFNQILSSDTTYIVDLDKVTANQKTELMKRGGSAVGTSLEYNQFDSQWDSNQIDTYFARIDTLKLDLKAVLKSVSQAELLFNDSTVKTAGVITSHKSGQEFFSGGTNRRVTRFTFINFLCKDFEDMHDTSISDFRVGRDVDRSPGGDSRIYLNSCKGCHAFQDQLRGAWAGFYDSPVNQRITVAPKVPFTFKYNKNASFYPYGFDTTNDSWINPLVNGKNSYLGFRGPNQGGGNRDGARTLGQHLANSRQFSICMSTRVFKHVCIRDAQLTDQQSIKDLADTFEGEDGYSFKKLFARAASLKCGDL